MPNVEYECAVDKTHQKKTYSVVQNPPPICCGRFMTQLSAPPQAVPQQQPAATVQAKKPVAAPAVKKSWGNRLFGD
ncbi:MAG: hypothetical protein COT18_07275 [Elusimicrobia bacterium CG08_land_8_20_14_0_20_59_10]|nr:MAG: hypothetical protein COT18_07275 [Elusimicrobia bacterium CG08_land_8_20_14_0_20_59_10]